ncbi:MAG: hypothetical protein K0Q79_1364 [Flavipsychrobacter sp.]|jgi:hypothetical protein|nr:hypothetical protein [Flavipsychrobacter sp.]
MSNYRKHIDNFFKEKLGRYRETPPPDVWEALESRLDGLAPAPVTSPYRWLIHTAIISSIVMLGVYVGVQKMNNNTDTSVQPVSAVRNQTTIAPQTTQANNTVTTSNQTTSTNITTPSVAANEESISANKPSNNPYNKRAKQIASANTKNNKNNHRTRNYDKKATPVNATEETYQYTTSNNKNTANPAPENETENQNINAASPNTTLSVVQQPTKPAGTDKKESTKTPSGTVAKSNTAKHKPIFPRFEAGVKMGYEGGFSADAAQKAVVAPYLQYNLSPKFSIMTQPAVKIASVRERQIGNTQTYYYANPEDAKVTSEYKNLSYVSGTEIIFLHRNIYTYTQKHDSIVKTNKIGGTSVQFELPVTVQYKIGKRTAVYGGVNMVYSKLTTIKENTYTQKDITRSYKDTVLSSTLPVPVPSMGIEYTGEDIANYSGPMKPAQSGSRLDVGYMVGVNYQLSKKLVIDALIQQTPSKADYKGGYNINAPLSAPYFRLSIGYKITK